MDYENMLGGRDKTVQKVYYKIIRVLICVLNDAASSLAEETGRQ